MNRTSGTSSRNKGESLLEVLLAMFLAAVLSVSSTRLHASQWRLHRESAQQLRASLLLDAWAETHRMVAALPDGRGSGSAALLDEAMWQDKAANWLEHGVMDFGTVNELTIRARLRWSEAGAPREPGHSVGMSEGCSKPAPRTACLFVSPVFPDMKARHAP